MKGRLHTYILAELDALEPGGREQKVAEVQEPERSHGLEHGELVNQDAQDLRHACVMLGYVRLC